MPRRYLFGPVDAAFADDFLGAARRSGECLAFGPGVDVSVQGMPASWEAFRALLPAGWCPDFVVLYLPHSGIPAGLWEAPLPLVGLAADWRLDWHACRLLAPRCDLVLADQEGAERLRREGCAGVSEADLSGCGASFLQEEEPLSARDVDVLYLAELHPALERERAPWLARVARLADRWRVLVAADVPAGARRALLRRARVVLDPGPASGGRLASEAAASGCLLLGEKETGPGGEGLEAALERCRGNEEERRTLADAARGQAPNRTFESLWQAALGQVEECWPELAARAGQRRPVSSTELLPGRVWQALGPYGPDPTLLADLGAALASEPQSAWLHNALGLVETLAGRVGGRVTAPLAERVAGHFLRALHADPRHLMAALNLAEALAAVEQGGQAAELARRALVLLGQEQAAGRPVPDAGHFPPARDLFRVEWERAAWHNTGRPAAEAAAKQSLLRWRLHALLAELTGDLVHHREAALARADLPAARSALGRALAGSGRHAEALPHLRRALAADPCDAEAARALAGVLAATGDHPGREALAAERRLLARAAPRLVRPEEWFAETNGGDEPPAGPAPGVSLCMIVRNEAANLGACLASVRDLVDEIIVIDTGSTDRTKDIAARFGARVFDFAWCDDFAAARNESLRHATRRWVLWLDADEQFDKDNRARLRRLLSGLGDEPAAYTMRQLSLPAAPGGASTAVDQVRLFRNHPEVRWQYRVHEQILLSIRRLGHEVRFTDVVLRHSGYQDQPLRRRKCERNLALLERAAAESPGDPFVAFNLGWGYQQAGRPADALPLLLRCRDELAAGVSIRRKLHSVLVNSLRDLGRGGDALAACRAGLVEYADDVELLFLEGLLLREGGDLDGAAATLRRLLTVRPEPHFAMVDPDLGGYKARHNLALVYRQQGRHGEAEAEWRAVVAERPDCCPAWLCLGELFLAHQRWAELEEAARSAEAAPAGRKDAAALRARAQAARGRAAAQPAATQWAAAEGRQQRVSLCMIVRNEEANLGACLGSVRDLVDEVVVVDTGSTDRTKEVAAHFGARVFDFPWVDSFAAARNESLRHATGDWVFWLDGDDRLDEDNRQRLRALFAGLDGDAAYVMKCRCVGDAASGSAAATSVVDHVRLFRNHPGLRWRYRVHEQILPAVRRLGHEVRRCGVAIDHTGYSDPALRQRKLERDLRLLLLEHTESPDDPFNLFNLGWLHIDRGRPDEALPLLRRSLELSAPTDSIVRKLHALITRCHRKASRLQEALAACRDGLGQCPGDAELLFEEGLLLRGLNDLDGAAACFGRLLASGPGEHFASLDPGIWGYKAHHQLAEIRRERGDAAGAEGHWRRALAERPDFAPAWVGLGEVCLRHQDQRGLEEAARALEALPPGRVEGLVLRGRGLLARRAFAEARTVLEEAAGLAPGSVWPLLILSHTLLQEGKDHDAAERVLRRILELEPGHQQAANNLAVLLRQRRERA